MKPGILKYFWAVHFLKSARTSPPESEVPLQVSQSDWTKWCRCRVLRLQHDLWCCQRGNLKNIQLYGILYSINFISWCYFI